MKSESKIAIWENFIRKPRLLHHDKKDNLKLSEKQAEALLGFVKFMIRSSSAEQTIHSRVNALKHFFYFVKKSPDEITREDLENYILNMQETQKPGSFNVNKSYLKLFFKWLYKVEEKGQYPEIVKWIEVKFIEPEEINEADLISWEETKDILIPACQNFVEKCLISIMRETGARINEILEANVSDVKMEENKAFIKLRNSKRRNNEIKHRSLVLLDSYYYLSHWLRDYKAKGDSPLFVNKQNERFSYKNVRSMLEKIKKRTNFKKPLNPHWFRHSQASDMAKILSDGELRVFGGWSKSSQLISRYTHLTSDDVNAKRLKNKGIVEIIVKSPKLEACPRCNLYIDFSQNKFCGKCGMALGQEPIKEQAELENFKENFDKHFKKMMKKEIEILKKDLDLVKDKNVIYWNGKTYYCKGKKIFVKNGDEMTEIAKNKKNKIIFDMAK